MKPDGNDGLAEVVKTTEAFIGALKSTPLVSHYVAAERQFRTDPGVPNLLADLRRRAAEFQRSQADGSLRPEQIEELRDRQTLFQTHPIVQNFQVAQQAVGLLFQETNGIISKILGIDFGQTAGRAGGAC